MRKAYSLSGFESAPAVGVFAISTSVILIVALVFVNKAQVKKLMLVTEVVCEKIGSR